MNKAFWISAWHSFLSGFVTALLIALKAVPTDTLFDLHTWTFSFVAGIGYAAVRAGVKAVWPIIWIAVKPMIPFI